MRKVIMICSTRFIQRTSSIGTSHPYTTKVQTHKIKSLNTKSNLNAKKSSLPQMRCLKWCKMINHRMWSSQTPLRHFRDQRGIIEDVLRKVEKKGLMWDRYYDLKSNQIGELLGLPKMGKTIHRHIHQFPKLDLSSYVQPIARDLLLVRMF
jgi:hypothetical protein